MSFEEIAEAWEETNTGEPEEGDYVIDTSSRRGYEVTPLGETYHPDDWDKMLADIRSHMEQSQFWPNVWLLSDHGNFHPLDITKE